MSAPNRAVFEKMTKKQLADSLTAAGHKALYKYNKDQLVNLALGLPTGEKKVTTTGRAKIYTIVELQAMTKPHLIDILKKRKIGGYSGKKKEELIGMILNPPTVSPRRGRPPGKVSPKAPKVSPKRRGRPPGKVSPKKRGRPPGKVSPKKSPRVQKVYGPTQYIIDDRGLLIRNPEWRG